MRFDLAGKILLLVFTSLQKSDASKREESRLKTQEGFCLRHQRRRRDGLTSQHLIVQADGIKVIHRIGG